MHGKGVRLYPCTSWLLAMGHPLGRQVLVAGGGGGQRGLRRGALPSEGQSCGASAAHIQSSLGWFLAPKKNLFGTPWHQLGFLRWYRGKESACQCRRHKRCRFDPWVGKIPWRRKWQPTPVFLPEKFHRQRSLVGYSSRRGGHKEPNTIKYNSHTWYQL